ncbi:unnamed protein product, partial [Mesorhabditis belari]|uniref:Gustatory receptor n=1 Tax=Mesorhabditis belari TaxID=2138241 RepID=A0AAF3J4W9_9BILA
MKQERKWSYNTAQQFTLEMGLFGYEKADSRFHWRELRRRIRQYNIFTRLLWLRFKRGDSFWIKRRNSLLMITICIISIALTIHDLSIVFYGPTNATSMGILMIIWNFHSSFSMVCLFYWQRYGSIERFLQCFSESDLGVEAFRERSSSSYRRTMIRFCAFTGTILFMMIAQFFVHLLGHFFIYFAELHREMINETERIFMQGWMLNVRMIVYSILFPLDLMVIHLYVTLSKALYYEMKSFNWLLRELTLKRDLKSELQDLICKHSRLIATIKQFNNVFAIYAFLMVGSTIPTFLFSIIQIGETRLHNLNEFLSALPSLLFCIYGFYAWTVVPALLYEEINDSKSIFCMNVKVWESQDQEVRAEARTLAIHLDQPELGVSLWGFAILSKTSILTTFSVLLTFWALLTEFHMKRIEERSINDTEAMK